MSSFGESRLLVVFDLDETLVHATTRISPAAADFTSGAHSCVVRPHARTLVGECLARYDVAVWTSAGSLHAETVVSEVFGDAARLRFVWSAEHCTPHRDLETFEDVPLKNLHKLRRRGIDLDRVVAIDDSPEKHQRTYGNLLRVQPWSGDQDDSELDDVRLYLRWLNRQPSIKKVEKRGWRHQTYWRDA
jgi:carboxy-terminal domain RNA polymerase II polypeptide A small phosphatase